MKIPLLKIVAHSDGDGCIEIISYSNKKWRALLFWPPGFSYVSNGWLINWNITKKFWFDIWKIK